MAKADRDELIEGEIPALRRYAYALTRDHEAADDLVQDCLERALSRWHLHRGADALRPWLFTILRNIFINAYHAGRRRGASVPLEEAPAPAVSPGQEGALDVKDVMAALDRLPEDYRSLILLVGVEEFSYSEAADILAIPSGTVMSRLARARRKLRELLEGEAIPFLRRVK
ncbi:RNA polymerase sigma factor [Ancylobacter mangrovi]|uniref:RNA polymerase sigma factor n=1 Tax=Ancylobacter mangrovi TaxID=2972472 RepID=A0A9X2PFC2_9HYPH|nr:RNA polymerase sigma factor [Ancylobacter mangrovi]MCS0497666.1 RNA polymerase sigma factor [Ancylobacter mangrovi]MCS0503237.1 RNA polymerase sigma factor [Ancylobacter mangrovi]